MTSNHKCKICNGRVSQIFEATVLKKYVVSYWQCDNCKFIQTDNPFWLEEAYKNVMTLLDVGLISRNSYYAEIIPSILELVSSDKDSYLDYGGGYGIFVRMMRDKGYNFYLHDLYASNLFARLFSLDEFDEKKNFAVITSFEVFEHLNNPKEETIKMLELSDTIIFSTELQPSIELKSSTDWWYFAPETGQHISFYTKKSLSILAESLGLIFHTNGSHLHLLSKDKSLKNPFIRNRSLRQAFITWLLYGLKNRLSKSDRKSLLQQDFQYYKNNLSN